MVIVVGSYSKITAPGIHFYRWDEAEHVFQNAGKITGIENPSFVTVDAINELVYTVTEKKKNADARLHIYKLIAEKNLASLAACIAFEGNGSCYLIKDLQSRHAFITNYGSGTLTVIKLPEQGSPGEVVQQLEFSGGGPDRERQEQPHLHAVMLSLCERFLYATDLGSDRIYRYPYQSAATFPIDTDHGEYQQLPPGSGPRHLVMSPDGEALYIITELSGEIFVFNTKGFLGGAIQRISLLQEGYSGKVEAADIEMHPSGKFLYASNRGNANEIVVFNVESNSGHLQFLQRTGAAGLSPRGLLICERQGLLLVANEQSDNVSIFKLSIDGMLEFSKEHLQIPCPTCIAKLQES